jgi:anti-sigma factor ChrR (cupin superfamily)
MAELEEVLDTLDLLVDANLSFPPKDIKNTARVWSSLLKDIPADTLKQAAMDHILTGKEFPKLSEIRSAASQVRVHNGASAAPNMFKDVPQQKTIWVASGNKDRAIFPAEVMTEIQKLEAKYYDSGLPTDAELERINKLTAPYRH